MARYIHFPSALGETVTAALGGKSLTIDRYGDVPDVVEMQAYAGRVNVLDAAIASVAQGNAVARSDGKTTLDLRSLTASASIPALLSDGRQAMISATAPAQKRGHPPGEHYWLPVDASGRFVCYPGQRHRKWYLSRSSAALTRAQIAADAGVSEATVTGAWLLTRPQYGGTAATAMHWDLFSLIRSHIVADNTPGRSDWYFLDRGYDYVTGYNYSNYNWEGFAGEDELHPMLIDAFGTGADPVIKVISNFLMLPFAVVRNVRTVRQYQDVGADLQDPLQAFYGFATAFEGCDIGRSILLQQAAFITVRETTILSAWKDNPKVTTSDGRWNANPGHIAGIYTAYTEDILVDSCLIDHTGWVEGYDYNGSVTGPMPISKYSHDLYFSQDTFGIMSRNNLLSRAASCSMQMRQGGHFEGNLLVDNNIGAALNSYGNGHFNNVIDNVITSAGYRRVAYEEGGYNYGYDVNGPLTVLVGNVLMHSANPDDPEEMSRKTDGWYGGVSLSAKLADDTQVWRWFTASQNVEGIPAATLNETTIQRFAGIKAGQASRTIAQFVSDTAAAPSIGAVVRDGVRWVKSRFGRAIPARMAPADLIFRPDPRTEGFRWDNRLNWSSLDLPGSHVADSADLDGHFVRFGTVNASVAALALGGGVLEMTSGKLVAGTVTDAGTIINRLAGQTWIGGAGHALSVEAISGLVAFTGAAADLDLEARGGQVLLGPDCTARSLIIDGLRPQVGWDGTGAAALAVAGRLEFRRGMVITSASGMERIRKVYKHIGKQITGSVSGFTARVAGVERTTARGGIYKIWLSDVVGTPQAGETFVVAPVLNADGTDTPTVITIATVGASGIAPLQRFRSGAIGTGLVEPTVTATLTLAATAQIVLPTGLPAGTHDLTGPGVTVVNNGATLPAGVALTGGKLVMTV